MQISHSKFKPWSQKENSILLNKIVDRVNEAKYITILVDETADLAGLEELSICVQYIDLKSLEIHEDFQQFVPTTDASGKGLSYTYYTYT